MSMLAERRRKQKWSLNPRGKLWSEDGNKFGQKMLEKMGWSVGKGLGAKEDGAREHVKISYKNDSKGMGFKETNDQWTEHEDNFSKLLEQLKTSDHVTTKETQVKSLVEKSKSSKARVHYHKFTKGKDLSGYSEKDLANIFGRKNLKKTNPEPQKCEVELKPEEEQRFGVETIRGGSMVDYFKKKLGKVPVQNGNSYQVGGNGVLVKVERDSDTEASFAGFGFSASIKTEYEENVLASKVEDSTVKIEDCTARRRKKKASCVGPEEDCKRGNGVPIKVERDSDTEMSYAGFGFSASFKTDDEENETEDSTAKTEDCTAKRRKKKTSCVGPEEDCKQGNEVPIGVERDSDTEMSYAGFGFSASFETNHEENETEDALSLACKVEDSIAKTEDCSTKRRKKKRRSVGLEEESSEVNHVNDEENVSTTNDVKKRKKKKRSITSEQECGDVSLDTSNDMEVSSISVEEVVKKTKKHADSEDPDVKKKTKKNKSTALENASTFVSYLDEECTPKKRKSDVELEQNETPKKKKKKTADLGLCNPAFEARLNDSIVAAKKKKKKKSKDAEESLEVGVTKKKKKKMKECTLGDGGSMENGVVNFCFEDFDENRENEVPDENPYEVKAKRKKKKKKSKGAENVFENPTYSESAPDRGSVNDSLEIPREDGGIANPALNLNSSAADETLEDPIADDLIINVISETSEPTPQSILQTPTPQKYNRRKKSVRFSDVNEERIIPNNDDLLLSPEELRKRMEVFDISRMIFERGVEKHRTNVGCANDAFDPTLKDSSYYDGTLEAKKQTKNAGIANVGFNNVQEDVERLAAGIDTCQAQVENDLNEARINDVLIGETGSGVEENVDTRDGTRLSFRKAKFSKSVFRHGTDELSYPKRSYKHLIKGDILLQFKNTNLGNIPGYANTV